MIRSGPQRRAVERNGMAREIVIRISVPDGVNVAVSQGTQQQVQQDRPFVERPAPPEPVGFCEIHDAAWKLVPAGTSKKTGKRYNSFWACSTQGCDQRPAFGPPAQPVLVDVSEDALPF